MSGSDSRRLNMACLFLDSCLHEAAACSRVSVGLLLFVGSPRVGGEETRVPAGFPACTIVKNQTQRSRSFIISCNCHPRLAFWNTGLKIGEGSCDEINLRLGWLFNGRNTKVSFLRYFSQVYFWYWKGIVWWNKCVLEHNIYFQRYKSIVFLIFRLSMLLFQTTKYRDSSYTIIYFISRIDYYDH